MATTVDSRIPAMWDRYQRGLSLSQVGREFGLKGATVSALFKQASLPRRSDHGGPMTPPPHALEAGGAQRRSAAERRREEMYVMYSTGATLEEVGRRFAVSRERVRQIFREEGLPVRSVRESAAMARELHLKRSDEVLAAFRQSKDRHAVAIALGIPESVVAEIVSSLPVWERRPHPKWAKRYSDEELIDCLREANESLGGILSSSAYSAFARARGFADGRPWPTHQTPSNRFGSWRKALHAAGLAANPSSPIAGQKLFEAGHCVDAIRHVARELGNVPTAAEYERVAGDSDGGLPSLATVRNRCGSWQGALRQAAPSV